MVMYGWIKKLIYIFYRVDNDSNDDYGYGEVKDGDKCKGI